MPVNVLLAANDASRCGPLVKSMRKMGLTVRFAGTGAELLRLHEDVSPGLVVLATDLPDIHALDVCRRVRRDSDVPLIMLGEGPGDLEVILALEVGADDFIAHDCANEEFEERIRAALRRAADLRVDSQPDQRLDFGEIVIDRQEHAMTVRDERQELTPTEMELIWTLAQRPREVITSADLLARVWSYPSGVRTRTLDVHVSRLRRKLGEDGRDPRHIITVRGVGYRFDPPSPR